MTQKQEQKRDDDDVKVKPQEKAQAAIDPMTVGPREVDAHSELPPGHFNNSLNEPPGSDVGGEAVPADPPVITGLEPDSCVIGDADFTLVVSGTGFTSASVIHFAGHDEPTTFVDGTLTTGVKPSLWAEPVVVQCSIKNGTVESEPVDFEFAAPVARKRR